MLPMTSIRIILRAGQSWSENGGMRLGAAFAYYALFSIAPLLIVAISIAGVIFGEEAAQGEVRKHLQSMMGKETAAAVEKMVETAGKPHDAAWAPTLSILFMIIAALGAFLNVRGSLCMIWKLEPPKGNTWLGMLWDYVLSLIMVFLSASMLLLSLAVGLLVPILQKTISDYEQHYWHWLEIGGSFLFLTILFAAAYRILSGGRIPWGYVWYGSFVAAVLFTVGKTLLSYYLVYSGTASMYGAAGSVLILLMWVYYSSQTLFFGAELIQARRTRRDWLQGK